MEKTRLIHPKASQRLKELVREYLDIAYYNGQGVEFPESTLQLIQTTHKIKQILSKLYPEDIEAADIFFTIYRELVSIGSALPSTGKFIDLLKPQEISEHQNSITHKLLSDPKEYEVYIPLRMVSTNDPLIISNMVRLTKADPALVSALPPASSSSLLGEVRLYDDIVYLNFRIKGILEIYTFSSQIKVKSEYKKIIASLIVTNILIKGSDIALAQPNMSLPIRTFIYCLHNNSEAFSFDLSVSESNLLQQLYISREDSQQSRLIDTNISSLFQFNSDSEQQVRNQIERIRTSLEWYFEGLTNDNETFSFILFCTAIEALLGSGNEQTSISYRLSDRISFLIARNVIERENIRKEFVETYNLRSDIIHKGKSKLSAEERKFLNFLRQSLEKALRKEIVLLPTQ